MRAREEEREREKESEHPSTQNLLGKTVKNEKREREKVGERERERNRIQLKNVLGFFEMRLPWSILIKDSFSVFLSKKGLS